MCLEDFDIEYKHFYRKGLLFAQSYLHDLGLADDIVSESMVVLWTYLNEEKQLNSPLSYLFSTIKNKILHYFRHEYIKQSIHQEIEIESSSELKFRINSLESYEPHNLYLQDIQILINKSLSNLNEQTYKVFMLSRMKDKSNKEISLIMGISIKGVEYHMSKALKQLRDDLKDYIK